MSELSIPKSWAETTLENGLTLINGRAYKQTEFKDKGTPIIRIQNLNNGDKWFYSDLLLPEDKYCENGDLLFAWSASFGPYIWNGPKSIYHYHIWKVVNHAGVNKQYTYYYLEHLTQEVKNKSHGLAMLHITKEKMEKMPFLLPPSIEQERISNKIESCFEKIDATEVNLSKIESLLEKLAIGFLTKNGEWLETSPLEELTEERVERIGKKNPKCRKIGVDNKLGVVDLRVTGKQNFENYKIVKQGDILYNPMRINVGSLALYNDSEDAITSPDYIVFSIRPEFSKWLIFKFLKSSFGAQEISKKLKGAVRERLYYKSLKEIKFPNPQKDTHKQAERIIEVVNTNFLSQKKTLLVLISKLKESILLKAFEGRLVEQIPSEGTGHELLAKIFAEKENKQNTAFELKIKNISPAKAVSSKGKKNGKK